MLVQILALAVAGYVGQWQWHLEQLGNTSFSGWVVSSADVIGDLSEWGDTPGDWLSVTQRMVLWANQASAERISSVIR